MGTKWPLDACAWSDLCSNCIGICSSKSALKGDQTYILHPGITRDKSCYILDKQWNQPFIKKVSCWSRAGCCCGWKRASKFQKELSMKLLVGISVKLKRETKFQLNIKEMGPMASLYSDISTRKNITCSHNSHQRGLALAKVFCYFSEEIIYTQLTKINYLDFPSSHYFVYNVTESERWVCLSWFFSCPYII